MQSNQVRDIQPSSRPFGGFRDELLATTMTLTLVVLVTFIGLYQLTGDKKADEETKVAVEEAELMEQTLGVTDEPSPEPVISALAELEDFSEATEGAVVYSVVPFGEDGEYDYDAFSISFTSPRVVFDAATNSRRRLLVDVMIKNRTVETGLPLRITCSIVKDGEVIVKAAAMHLPQSRPLAVGEMYEGTASLALIEATDARELVYEPGEELARVSHFLY